MDKELKKQEKDIRRKQHEAKELIRWQKEKEKSKPKSYLAYMFLIVTVVYIADEICTQIGVQMQSILANNLFANEDSLSFLPKFITDLFGSTETSSARLALTNSIATAIFGTLAVFYKPLSDRFGRKIFLVINTFGMGIAMIIISLATNIPIYFLGVCLITFFTPHDMQATYIYESSPKDKKGMYYSIAKFFATIGMMLIGVLRSVFAYGGDGSWRTVYLIPGILTLVATVFALIFVRETDAFIDNRIKLLSMTDEEKAEKAELQKRDKEKNGGFFRAIGFIFKHKQLRWCVVAYGLVCVATVFTQHYENTANIGAALKEMGINPALSLLDARQLNNVGSYVNKVILIFPVGSAFIQLMQGFLSDKLGRRVTEIIMGAITLVTYVLFYIGTNVTANLWNPYLIGLLIGTAVGSFWALGDIVLLIVQESVPTNMRSSVVSATCMLAGLFSIFSDLSLSALSLTLGDRYIGITTFIITAPALLLCLLVSFFKVKENKTIDLTNITGDEFN